MDKLKNKKFALIFGQSVEGCCVTRTGSEMWYWCKKNNIDFTIYSYDERIYNRRNAHEMDFKSFTMENIEETLNELNQ